MRSVIDITVETKHFLEVDNSFTKFILNIYTQRVSHLSHETWCEFRGDGMLFEKTHTLNATELMINQKVR